MNGATWKTKKSDVRKLCMLTTATPSSKVDSRTPLKSLWLASFRLCGLSVFATLIAPSKNASKLKRSWWDICGSVIETLRGLMYKEVIEFRYFMEISWIRKRRYNFRTNIRRFSQSRSFSFAVLPALKSMKGNIHCHFNPTHAQNRVGIHRPPLV